MWVAPSLMDPPSVQSSAVPIAVERIGETFQDPGQLMIGPGVLARFGVEVDAEGCLHGHVPFRSSENRSYPMPPRSDSLSKF